MSESQPPSGSRWEPAPAAVPQAHHEHATDLIDRSPARPARPARRRRLVLAAVGTALLLVGGAGGYALGHASAGSTPSTVREHRGAPDGFPGFRGGAADNGDGDGDGGVNGDGGSTGPST